MNNNEMPEWDDEMKEALRKREPHKKRVIEGLLTGLDNFVDERTLGLLNMVAEHAFEGGVEAEVKNHLS